MRRLAALFVFFFVATSLTGLLLASTDVSPEFLEYEKIVLTPLVDPMDSSIPDWRTLYLAKIAKYEAYLKKYPNSPLVAEAKLRLAEFYKDVEKPEIYPLRVKMYECITQFPGDAVGSAEDRIMCIKEFDDKTKKWRDPVYTEKAIKLLIELVGKYGRQKRYNMEEPRIGGFKWTDEEIGAQALYLLSRGADPKNKKKILKSILDGYKPGPKLRGLIEEDLKRLEGVK